MSISTENKIKLNKMLVSLSIELTKLQSEITFLEVEIEGLRTLSKNISYKILEPSNAVAEVLEFWSEKAELYNILAKSLFEEKLNKRYLMLEKVKNITLEAQKMGLEILDEINNLSIDIKSYNFEN